MKRILVILAVLLLSTTFAFADATNWVIRMTPSGYGVGSMGESTVGTFSTYTDGLDTDYGLDLGAEGESNPAPPEPYAGVECNAYGGMWGNLDAKAPITGTETKAYTIHIFAGGEAIGPFNVNFTLGFQPYLAGYEPTYSFGGVAYQYTFQGNMVPGGSQTFTAENPMPNSWDWTAADGDVLTLTVSPAGGYAPPGGSPGIGVCKLGRRGRNGFRAGTGCWFQGLFEVAPGWCARER